MKREYGYVQVGGIMKQILLNIKSGDITVQEVPIPVMKNGGLLIENHYSVISGGTELSTIQLANSSYLGKARKKPDLFKQVMEMARKEGPLTTYHAVMGRLNQPEPLGYSCAGIVTKTTDESRFKKGDRVACGGAGYANHADMVYVPSNLCVKIPDNVSTKDAAYTTIGSIAMQGVRNADNRVGEKAVVIGLGLIGLITIQILKATGLEVFGIDLDKDKVKLGKKLGMDSGGLASDENIASQAEAFTNGNGFDSVIITAATQSKEPLILAGKIARQKGKVVLVGVVGMEIPRDIYYPKELEFVISCSYGPGRYDPEYEEFGKDYPYGYVRWTENRNMEAFLNLVSEGKVKLDKITTHEFKIEDAPKAYEIITGKAKEPYLGIVLKYDAKKKKKDKIQLKAEVKKVKGEVGIGWVGAGSFATSTLLPAIKGISGVNLIGLSASSGAKATGENYGFKYITSDYSKLLDDEKIDAIVITTRNSLHAEITKKAVEKGKHVFVEKPMVITKKELSDLKRVHKKHPDIVIQVGFNRRYAPLNNKIMDLFKDRKGPLIINYRVNAGKLPKDHWVYHDKEGGSRFITELCHFVDYCKFVSGSEISDHNFFQTNHKALGDKESRENVVMSLRFKDGSLGNIIYNTIGDSGRSKEFVEVYGDGIMARLTDFRMLEVYRNGKVTKSKDHLKTDKGHRKEMEVFLRNIKKGYNPFDEYVKTHRILL